MSYKLTLVENHNLSVMGHLFCNECATELNVVLLAHNSYLNPQYSVDWDLPWHEFHNVKMLFPNLLKAIWDLDFHAECPCCHNRQAQLLVPLDNALFDLKLIKRSLDTDNKYVCINCEGEFASQKCVIKTGNEYICGDCAAYAME